jgi:hypothetical protein
MTASRAGRRGPTGPARAGCPCSRARRRGAWCSRASRWCPLTAHVLDVVERVVEVGGLAALAPAVPARGVVVTGEAHREREQVGALEREVDRVVGAEADAERGDVVRLAVGLDVRHDLLDDPRLVALVVAGALLERKAVVGPRLGVERVDGVELHAPALDQVGDRADHPLVLEVPRAPALGREREHRPPPVPVGDHGAAAPDRGRVQLGVAAGYHAAASRRPRCGSNASRQAV